jgi:Ca-activated chloride channel family protein
VPAGSCTLQASYVGYVSVTKAVEVIPDSTATVSFLLRDQSYSEKEIVVESRAAMISKERADTHHVVSSQQHFRGGRGGEVAKYIDGVPVKDPDVVNGGFGTEWGNAQSGITGGFEAGYSNGQSGIVNLETGEVLVPPPSSFAYDELWVIERPEPSSQRSANGPGCGAILAEIETEEGEKKEVPIPLKHTSVESRISAYIATVRVQQQFHNPFDHKIEAVYHFPLPQNAAVNDFVMTVGDRRIRGIIREREEAERIYSEAKRQGYVASLLTQERPNIFTQSVANIEPGKEIDVDIHYFHTLAYVDGWYEYVFPMVVGPRFNPPGQRDGIGAVARGATGISRQSTEIEYLSPEERSGHDISLATFIDAGVSIEKIESVNHAIRVDRRSDSTAEVTLKQSDNLPNKDFVLRYRVDGDRIKTAFMTHEDERGGFFTLVLYPPKNQKRIQRFPVEMVFVVDCSGSMQGKPLAKAKAAIDRALRLLDPDDTFQIIRFSNSASQLGPVPIRATRENVKRGLAHLHALESGGGTMMIRGIKAALDFPHDPRRLRLVTFATDGYIGNEADIFREIHQRIGDARIFSFGIGSSPNRHLLEGMARFGKGAVAFVGLDESAGQAVDRFYERIRYPAFIDIDIEWGDCEVTEVYPRRIPDLFLGRAVIVTGRFTRAGEEPVRLTGMMGGRERELLVDIGGDDDAREHKGIPSVWARRKIMDLRDIAVTSPGEEIDQHITQFALDYGLVSRYTAFVAVDSRTQTGDEPAVTTNVAVPVPDGVLYETTVDDPRRR